MSRDSKHDLEVLRKIFGAKLEEALQFINDDDYLIEIPDAERVDMTLHNLASLVARSSNVYGRISRLYGIASAEYKLAKGAYDYAYKTARGEGSNADERKANAMEQVEHEHQRLTAAESIMHMLGRMEEGAKLASESARKILDKLVEMGKADLREHANGPSGYRDSHSWQPDDKQPPFDDALLSEREKEEQMEASDTEGKDKRWG